MEVLLFGERRITLSELKGQGSKRLSLPLGAKISSACPSPDGLSKAGFDLRCGGEAPCGEEQEPAPWS